MQIIKQFEMETKFYRALCVDVVSHRFVITTLMLIVFSFSQSPASFSVHRGENFCNFPPFFFGFSKAIKQETNKIISEAKHLVENIWCYRVMLCVPSARFNALRLCKYFRIRPVIVDCGILRLFIVFFSFSLNSFLFFIFRFVCFGEKSKRSVRIEQISAGFFNQQNSFSISNSSIDN